MKNKFRLLAILVLSAFTVAAGNDLYAQNNTADVTQQMIENRHFIFVATSVSPLRGTTRYLNETYEVRVQKIELTSYLPYFGVAQSPAAANDEGIKFTSKNFDYSVEKGKKNSWDVQIKFNDQTGTSQFHFLVFEDGHATLDVTSNFRDPISFSGYLKKL